MEIDTKSALNPIIQVWTEVLYISIKLYIVYTLYSVSVHCTYSVQYTVYIVPTHCTEYSVLYTHCIHFTYTVRRYLNGYVYIFNILTLFDMKNKHISPHCLIFKNINLIN